jgi:hypothetical protein
MAVDVEPRVLLTKREVADLLRCSERTVERYSLDELREMAGAIAALLD